MFDLSWHLVVQAFFVGVGLGGATATVVHQLRMRKLFKTLRTELGLRPYREPTDSTPYKRSKY